MNILELIDNRIEIAIYDGLHARLVDLGICGKKLRNELYDDSGIYRDLSIDELKELRVRAEKLVDEWEEFYNKYRDVEGLIIENQTHFTDAAMVCNDYIKHANDFIKQ